MLDDQNPISAPVAVVTGATSGIGREIVLRLAQEGYHVVLIGRDAARGRAVQTDIAARTPDAEPELMLADLSLLAATRDVAARILARHPRISLLVNNAGTFQAERRTTAEGFDAVLATNLLSPTALTLALLPALQAAAPARIVNVGSSSSDQARLDPDELELGARWGMVRAYGQSKLALMMATFALAGRLDGSGVVANVVHPGFVASRLVRTGGPIGLAWRLLAHVALTPEQGADAPLHVALSPEFATTTGVYVKRRRAVRPNPRALDRSAVERVWASVQRLLARGGGSPPAAPAP